MKIFKLFLIFIFLISLSSCARAPKRPLPDFSTQSIYPPVEGFFKRADVYHEVGPGETVWRLSKMYDVTIDDIMKANRLKNANRLKTGEIILIPDAGPLRPVIPLYPSKKWKYIIIHHTATDVGSALEIDRMHLNRGFWHGIGYHFLIDNGTYGKLDGQIEVAPRWLKQLNGAHCSASKMNTKGIGIGLVGNFSKEKVSKRQMGSLVYLVKILMKYYKVPVTNIIGHGQVLGAATECPGKKFPWRQLKQQLR